MSKRIKLLIVGVVAVVAVAGGAVWWFLRDDAPKEVSLEDAVEQVQSSSTTTTTATDDTTAGSTETTTADSTSADGIEGDWTVDTTTGDFDYESATGTFAGFRIKEKLSGVGDTTAVGRTGDVSGGITIEGTTLTKATFQVDLTSITTNESRRDSRVQDALETGDFPTATFELTSPVDLGSAATTGGPVKVTATGDLTIHGETHSVDVAIEAQLVNGTVVVVGSTDITFSDYGVSVPQSPVVLSVSDSGTVEMQLLLVR